MFSSSGSDFIPFVRSILLRETKYGGNLCEEYKHRLEELTQELLSAKKVIQLLQEDVKVDKVTNANQTVRCGDILQFSNSNDIYLA